MDDVTGFIWPYISLLSITPDQIELERRKKDQCVHNELLNQILCKTTTLRQGTDLTSRELTLTLGQHETWPLLNKKYIIRRVLRRQTRSCQKFCFASIFVEVLLKIKPLHLGHWPDLWRHRLIWDLKFRYQSLRLVTPDTLVFSAKL